MKVTVIPEADLRKLSKSVIQQAMADLAGKDPIKAIDALAWFAGGDFPIWAELWDAPFADPYRMLGCLARYEEERKVRYARN